MRTAITLGFTKDGNATIISPPSVSIHKQRADFKTLVSGKGKFDEIQLWESGRGMRRSKKFGNSGNVNFNAAHLVEDQQKKGKKLSDLTPKEGEKGGVNFNAAHPVEKQQNKKAARRLPDLTPDAPSAKANKKEGVNFDASIPVDEQGKTQHGKTKKSSQKTGQKTAEKKSTQKSGAESRSSEDTAAASKGDSEEAGGPSL